MMAASVGIRGVLVASRAVLREGLPPSWAAPDRPGIGRLTALGGFLPPGRTRGRPASTPAAKRQPLRTNSTATGRSQLPVAECSKPSSSGPELATRYPAACASEDNDAADT